MVEPFGLKPALSCDVRLSSRDGYIRVDVEVL